MPKFAFGCSVSKLLAASLCVSSYTWIDLKNQGETLCFEAERELGLFTNNITEDNKKKVAELIENVRASIQQDNIEVLGYEGYGRSSKTNY